MSIINRIRRVFVLHGMAGGARVCVDKAWKMFMALSPGQRREHAVSERYDWEFDKKWGVDTSGRVVPDEAEVVGPNWLSGGKYQGCNPDAVERMLNELAIQQQDFAFVDFGSGKGRAILVASRFPFREVIGVEYSEVLTETARRNLRVFPVEEMRCHRIEAVCADATSFPIPKGPVILFLYNPFGRFLMEQVVYNVARSFQEEPRRIIVMYFNPEFAEVWRSTSFLREVSASEWAVIYDTEPSRSHP